MIREALLPASSAPSGCPAAIDGPAVLAHIERTAACRVFSGRYGSTGFRLLGEGPPLYFLPGVAGSHRQFALTAWLLRDRYRCALLDGAETRQTRTTSGDLRLDRLAAHLLEMAAWLGDERFAVFGTSLGASIGLRAAAGGAEIEALVVQGASLRARLSRVERGLVAAGRRSRRVLGELRGWRRVQAYNHRVFFPGGDPWRWEFFLRDAGATPVRAVAARAGAAGQVDLRPLLRAVGCPVLLLHGEGEASAESRLRELAQGLARTALRGIANAGRLAHITHPHLVARAIDEFLTACSGGGG